MCCRKMPLLHSRPSKENIRDFIAGTMRVEYDRRLRQHLYEEGLKSGDVEINIDIAQSEKTKNGE